MKQSGRQEIRAPRKRVWEALNDTLLLKKCIDGCESFEAVAPQAYRAKVRAHIGPVNALFHANLRLQTAPDSARDVQRFSLEVELERAAAGFGKGVAQVSLQEKTDQLTLLSYELEASVGGKIAQVGGRLVEAAASAMAASFFANLEKELAMGNVGQSASRSRSSRGRGLLWAGAGAGAAVVLLVMLLSE